MRNKIERYINLWEQRCYSDGLPDEAPIEIDDMVPSYKRIATAILKNNLEHIGISSPRTEYYGMLKCIELGKKYIKPKHMTQSELKGFIFNLINRMIEKQCYIKGYGDLFRVVDSTHSPVRNINKQEMNVLLHNGIIVVSGLVRRLNVLANPFQHSVDIKIPSKDE